MWWQLDYHGGMVRLEWGTKIALPETLNSFVRIKFYFLFYCLLSLLSIVTMTVFVCQLYVFLYED